MYKLPGGVRRYGHLGGWTNRICYRYVRHPKYIGSIRTAGHTSNHDLVSIAFLHDIIPAGSARLRNKRETFLKAQLTDRELEVLQLVVEGYTAQEIANRLFVSIKTVAYYRINLLLKQEAKNTALLVSKALKMGLAR